MNSRIVWMAVVAMVLAPVLARAADTAESYPDVASIPASLRESFQGYGRQYEEQYISQVLSVLRNNVHSPGSLDQRDVDEARVQEERQVRDQRIHEVMAYDVNFDGKVTADEIRETMKGNRGDNNPGANDANIENQVTRLMKAYDADKDGVITLKELVSAPIGNARLSRQRGRYGQEGRLAQFLALAPGKDGVLTAAELERLARKAFHTVDKNHDGVLSEEEMAALRDVSLDGSLAFAVFGDGCVAAQPAEDERIVLVGISRGGSLSDVSVAGQSVETRSVRVNIAPGAKKLYILALSGTPAILEFTGDTGRIGHAVLSGPSPDGKVETGATGLEARKVSFVESSDAAVNCNLTLPLSPREASDADRFAGMLRKAANPLLGRDADIAGTGYYNPTLINIDDENISPVFAAEPQPAPAGFDPEVWKEMLYFAPGGLANIKGHDVVSEAPAEPYAIAPGEAGLAQLVADGVLVREPSGPDAARIIVSTEGRAPDTFIGLSGVNVRNDAKMTVNILKDYSYKIVKGSAVLPTGLGGSGEQVRFVLAKGIAAPSVKPGSVCVISEETQKPVKGSGYCPGTGRSFLLR